MNVIKMSGITLAVTCLLATAYLLMVEYDQVITDIVKLLTGADKKEKVSSILTEEKITFIVVYLISVSFIGALTYLHAKFIYKNVVALKALPRKIVVLLSGIEKVHLIQLAGILTISLLIKLIFVITLPITTDEAATFITFSARSIFSSISYYPAPNNHILHSLLTNFTYHLPFSEIVNLRLANLTINTVSAFLLFLLLAKEIGQKTAIAITLIFCFLPIVITYGVFSRGYSLVLLAFIVCFYASLQLLKNSEKEKEPHFLYLYLGSVMGIYTMPSFVYPYLSIFLFLAGFFILTRRGNLYKLVLSGTASGLTVLLLYSPVFIVSGLDSVFKNKWVVPRERLEVVDRLYAHFANTSLEIFGMSIFAVLSIIVFFVIRYKKSFNRQIFFSLFIIFITPAILILHSVVPFPRTWIYLSVPTLFVVGYYLKKSAMNSYVIYSAAILFALFSVYNFQNNNISTERPYKKMEEVASYIKDNEIKNLCIVNVPLAPVLKFYLWQQKHSFNLIEKDEGDGALGEDVNEYDYLLLNKGDYQNSNYQHSKTFADTLFLYKKSA